jgi:hypothetical protein
VTLVVEQQQVFIVNQDLAAQPRQSHSTQ